MRIGLAHWLVAISLSVTAHGALMLGWQAPSEGGARPPQGPSVSVAASLAGVLGEPVAIEASGEAAREVVQEPLAPVAITHVEGADRPPLPPPTEPQAARRVGPVLAATAPLDPVRELSGDPGMQSVPVSEPEIEDTIVPPPVNKLLRERKKDAAEEARRREGEEAKRAARQGNNREGSGAKKSAGGGRSTASAGQIASFKSQVRARMAACVSARLSGGQRGTVTIRFGVGGSGKATGVGVSGSGAISSAAASAARGCTFPKPPPGASALRFSFPVTVR